MRVYLAARGVYGFVDFPGGWPGVAGGWPSIGVLAGLAEGMAEVTRECPTCPDVSATAFLLALAEAAPPDVAAELRELAARWQ